MKKFSIELSCEDKNNPYKCIIFGSIPIFAINKDDAKSISNILLSSSESHIFIDIKEGWPDQENKLE